MTDASSGRKGDQANFADLCVQFGATLSGTGSAATAKLSTLGANVGELDTASGEIPAGNTKSVKASEKDIVPGSSADFGALIVVPVPIPPQPVIQVEPISSAPMDAIPSSSAGGLTNCPTQEIGRLSPVVIPNSTQSDLGLASAPLSESQALPMNADLTASTPPAEPTEVNLGYKARTSSLDVEGSINLSAPEFETVQGGVDALSSRSAASLFEPQFAGSGAEAVPGKQSPPPEASTHSAEMQQPLPPNSAIDTNQHSSPDPAQHSNEYLAEAAARSHLSTGLAGSEEAKQATIGSQAPASGKTRPLQKSETPTSDTLSPVPNQSLGLQEPTLIATSSNPSPTHVAEVSVSSSVHGPQNPARRSSGAIQLPDFGQSDSAVAAPTFTAALDLGSQVSAGFAPPSPPPSAAAVASLPGDDHSRPITKEAGDDLSQDVTDNVQSGASVALASNGLAGNAQVLHPASAGSNPQVASDTPAPLRLDAQTGTSTDRLPARDIPQASAISPLHLAHTMDKSAHSEMRIGFNSSVFGSIEVRTVIRANDVGVVIGSEKGDLRGLMTTELPGIANTLLDKNLNLTQVSFQQPGFGSASYTGGGGSDADSRYFQYAPGSGSVELPEASEAGTILAESETLTRSGLSILA